MKYLSVIILVLLFVSCRTPIKQRDLNVAGSVKSYVDSLSVVYSTFNAPKFDRIKIMSVDSISDAKHLEMEIDAIQTAQTTFPGDSTTLNNRGLTAYENWKMLIDSIRAIKTNNQFWGYHVKAKVYSHYGSEKANAKENDFSFFVSKKYQTSIDAKNLFKAFKKH